MESPYRTAPTGSASRVEGLPPEAEVAFFGALLMLVGVVGPWLVGSYAARRGFEFGGGDGWLVLITACASVLALANPLRRRTLPTGLAVVASAAAGEYICLVHLTQLRDDGVPVGWGLYVAAAGAALAAMAGVRIALSRRR